MKNDEKLQEQKNNCFIAVFFLSIITKTVVLSMDLLKINILWNYMTDVNIYLNKNYGRLSPV